MKSMNSVSLHLRAWERVFEPGLRLRPFEFVMHLGLPRESKNKPEKSVKKLIRAIDGNLTVLNY